MNYFHPSQWTAIPGPDSVVGGPVAIGAAIFVQSTLILAAGLLAAGALRRRSPLVRSAILRASLVGVLVCPAASWMLARAGINAWRISLPHLGAPAALAAAALAVSGLLLLRLALAIRRVGRVRREARSASVHWIDDAGRCARVLRVTTPPVFQTERLESPCVVGWKQPAILLPARSTQVRHDVLLHELAHLRRRDCFWQALALGVRAVFWFQPLMWMLTRRLAESADEACDDVVVAYGSDRADYARVLIDTVERCQTPWMASGCAVGMTVFKSAVAKRVVRIMDNSRKISIDSRRTTALAVLLFGAAITLLAAAVVTIPAIAADAPAPIAPRAPVPDAPAQAKTEKVIRDVFGNYATGTASDRAATAAKLIDQAATTQDDPVARFVLLKDAADLAAGVGDARTAMRAADMLASTYAIDGGEVKLNLLRKSAAIANNPAAAQVVAEEGLSCADFAVAAGNIDLANRYMQPTETAARNAKNVTLLLAVQGRAGEIKWMQQEHAHSKTAADKLAKNPADPDANLTMGRYLCLVKGDWAAGIPALAKGPSPALHAAAASDLSNPATTDKQVAAGDLWWDAAEKEQAGAQKALRRRAAYWYAQAVANPQFAGLSRARVEKRLSQAPPVGDMVANVPPAVGQPAVPNPVPAPTPPVNPPPGDSIFSEIPSAAAGRKSVVMFYDTRKSEAIFKAVGGGAISMVKPDDTSKAFIGADPFAKFNVIVFEPNRICDTSPDVLTEAAFEKLRHFVERGGDLVIFEQCREGNWDRIHNAFGIKRDPLGPDKITKLAPGLSARVQAAGLTEADIFKIDFAETFTLPANSIVLVSNNKNANLAAVVPHGKGRVIVTGASLGGHDEAFDAAFFDYIYSAKPSKTRPQAAPLVAPAGSVDLLRLVDPSRDAVAGKWTRVVDGLMSPGTKDANRIRLPYNPPAEYDLRVVFTLHAEKGAIGVMIAHNDASGMWFINYPNDCRFRGAGDPAHMMPEKVARLEPKLTIGTRHEAILKIRNDSISTFIDGKAMGQITEDYSQCRLDGFWSIGNHAIGISGGDAKVTFHSVDVHEISGAVGSAPATPATPSGPAPAASNEAQAFAKQRNALPAGNQIAFVLAQLKQGNGGSDIQANIRTDSDGTLHVDIVNQDALVSITPLYGLKVAKLNLDTCRNLRSLDGVQGMPLTELNLINCAALEGDLSALTGMPLTRLGLRDCKKLRSLNGIEAMALTEMNLDNCFALEGDLSALKGMPLARLSLRDCRSLKSLSGIEGMALTGKLNMDNCFAVQDISSLKGMQLTELSLLDCRELASLNGLQGIPLTKLNLWGCKKLKGLDGLQGAPLKELHLPKHLGQGNAKAILDAFPTLDIATTADQPTDDELATAIKARGPAPAAPSAAPSQTSVPARGKTIFDDTEVKK